ncbi:MAG: family 16 glycosylhydrolase [Wenzhouxiangellaceae bacterium]
MKQLQFCILKSGTGLVALIALGLFAGAAVAQSCQNLVWSDEFDGTQVDLNNWEFQVGDGCAEGICGWGNNELQYYRAENATVDNGVLKITAKRERVRANAYTSARMRTANMPGSGEWTNGRFEARIKLPEGQGLWPAFWMLPTDPDVGWPTSGEIDIVESTGKASMLAFGTIHFGDPWPDNSFTGNHILTQPGKWSDGFHIYAIEWTPFEIRWYLDDILYSVKTPADMADPGFWTFENYQYHFLLNVAVGGTLGGAVDDSIFPVNMEVDYVRVYDSGQPSMDGPNIVAPTEVASYTVIDENGSNSTYAWSLPPGATLLSGQGTSTAQVDFTGASSGIVAVTVDNSCGTHPLEVAVFVEPDHGVETVLDNFDGTSNMFYTFFDGTADFSGGQLTYTRNSASLFDVIAADTAAIPDAAPFVIGDKAFVMDFNNTDPALIGKKVLVQLENSTVATPDNFPSGRHSSYEAFIEHANGWQTLRFRLSDRIDGETGDADVNSIIFLIDPNAFTGDTYVIDNIGILGADDSGVSPLAASLGFACTDLDCSFDGSGSTGNIVSYAWDFGDGAGATGATANHTYAAAGDYTVTLTVTDDTGATAVDSAAVSVTSGGGGEATSVIVSEVVTGTQNVGQGAKLGTATVTLLNNLGEPVANATVTGEFSGTWNETQSAATDAQGVAVLTTSSTAKGSVTVNFCVGSVTDTLLTLDTTSSTGLCP